MKTKFSITKLEEVRKNPSAYAHKLKDINNTTDFMRQGKFAAWKRAVYRYHKTNNIVYAKSYLYDELSKFKTLKGKKNQIDEYLDNLEIHVNSHNDYNYQFLNSQTRINISLSSELYISGEVPIVNMITDGGFALFFFQEQYIDWEDELRFPVLQNYFANIELGCDLSQIDVGIYCVETSQHHSKNFSKQEVSDALQEIKDISDIMSNILS